MGLLARRAPFAGALRKPLARPRRRRAGSSATPTGKSSPAITATGRLHTTTTTTTTTTMNSQENGHTTAEPPASNKRVSQPVPRPACAWRAAGVRQDRSRHGLPQPFALPPEGICKYPDTRKEVRSVRPRARVFGGPSCARTFFLTLSSVGKFFRRSAFHFATSSSEFPIVAAYRKRGGMSCKRSSGMRTLPPDRRTGVSPAPIASPPPSSAAPSASAPLAL